MSRIDHDRATNILAEAMGLPAHRRSAFLDSTCGGEADLRRELDELLRYAEGASAAFEAASEQIVQPDPDRIGPYELLELIGEGGMAVVYRAQQHHPVKRLVAIKLIKLGMDTRQFVSRFESERQVLATMDHPNVARVFHAGSTKSGRPYFVMEYVAGQSILRWCDARMLSIRQRLELFVVVCEAVEHAHRKGIIHRDLKDSNVLIAEVDGRASPKVIDFGVAKAISERLVDRTALTEHGQLIGTPEYMSPEQAERGATDIDTRSDVYSLGVLLYELVTGVQPIKADVLRGGSFEQVQKVIRETETPRPSTRLAALSDEHATRVAQQRGTPVRSLVRELRSELEWIPLKAMRKDREQRYRSASELADDVRNYLAGRPLTAAPESYWYRARKALRRHRVPLASATAVFLALSVGTSVAVWQAVRATRALRRTAEAADEVREVNRFLTEDLLASAAPEVARGSEITVREALDRAAESVSGRFDSRPLTEAALRSVLANTYDALGLPHRALEHAQAALDLTRGAQGPDDAQALAATAAVGKELAILHRHAEAEPLLRDAVARAERRRGADDPVTIECLNALARTLRMQRKFAEAEPLYRRVLESDRRTYGPRSAEVAQALNSLAVLLNTQRRAAEAEPLYREALAIRAALLGKDHPSYLKTVGNLARVVQDQGRLDEATSMMRDVIREEARILGEDHPSTLLTMNNLATLLAQQQRFDEAEALHREVLTRRTRAFGEDDPDTLQSMGNVGIVLLRRGRHAEAEVQLRAAFERQRKVLGETHAYTVAAMVSLATAYIAQEKFGEAEPLLVRACEPDAQTQLTPELRAQVFARHGLALVRLNHPARAEPALLEARRRLTEMGQTRGDAMRSVLAALAEVCDQTNRPDEAARRRAELAVIPPATAPSTQAATQPAAPKPASAVR